MQMWTDPLRDSILKWCSSGSNQDWLPLSNRHSILILLPYNNHGACGGAIGVHILRPLIDANYAIQQYLHNC